MFLLNHCFKTQSSAKNLTVFKKQKYLLDNLLFKKNISQIAWECLPSLPFLLPYVVPRGTFCSIFFVPKHRKHLKEQTLFRMNTSFMWGIPFTLATPLDNFTHFVSFFLPFENVIPQQAKSLAMKASSTADFCVECALLSCKRNHPLFICHLVIGEKSGK